MHTDTPSTIKPLATLLTVLAAALIAAPPADACEGCNRSFFHEMMMERGDTPAAADLLAAVENQQGLPLQGISAAFDAENPPKTGPLLAQTGAVRSVVPAAAPSAAPTGRRTPTRAEMAMYEGHDFIDIIRRDLSLPIPPTSYVPQGTTPDKRVTIELDEGRTYLGNNVVYEGFLTNGKVPGPTIIVEEGDIVEFTVVNKGSIPHGASIHAAYTQTSKYLGSIAPGQSKTVTFRAATPGVYLYHCAPGGHAIPMHVLFGQYGMMVVKPKKEKYQLEKLLGHGPDVEIYLTQHEWYASGKDAIEGNPAYVTFNGKIFRYIEEPIKAKPGDYVRIYFLNVGPNLISTFHLVGIIWDFAYWQGHPEAVFPGGQTVTAGPSDSWVVEFRVPPDEGAYTMLSHAVGSTSRGAIGLLVADRDAETPVVVSSDGPKYTKEEMDKIAEGALRTISPFKPGINDMVPAVEYGNDVKEVTVQIIGNSFHPKELVVTPGTKITFVNEDVFSYLAGEFSGIHNAVATSGPDRFATPLLSHAESYTIQLDAEGEYSYICTPHPYMEGKITVRAIKSAGFGWQGTILALLALLAIALSLYAVAARRR